jgi:alpha-galactosidase
VDLHVKDARALIASGTRAGMQIVFAVAILVCICGAAALDNGLARSPPMGWRSWNAYGSNIHQDLMNNAADMMVDSSRGFSLKDRGYTRVGLDDYYQLCGAGAGGSFHNASGYPIIDQSLFPDMKSELFPLHSHYHLINFSTLCRND